MKYLKLLFIATIIITSYTLTAQVAITTDGSDPDASAMLDVKSTKKGFLPPRMTAAEIGTLLNPANGLMVFNTDDEKVYVFVSTGNAWKELNYGAGTIPAYDPPEVGDSYGGGIVAYILQIGDPGYVEGEVHGLIVSTADLSNGIQWYNGTYTTTNATGTAIGTGSANTTLIINVQGATSTDYAAGLCRAYSAPGDGGLYDWYLPSKDELNKIYIYSVEYGVFGDFASAYYWSSSEYGNNDAWSQHLDWGDQPHYDKDNKDFVRAVRAF
jgi:hypothetical protein